MHQIQYLQFTVCGCGLKVESLGLRVWSKAGPEMIDKPSCPLKRLPTLALAVCGLGLLLEGGRLGVEGLGFRTWG